MFRNRWLALLWVAVTAASASLFVGEDGGVERLTESARQIQAQRTALAAEPVSVPVEADPVEPVLPPLLPAGEGGDPANPQVGDVFIDPVSGNRVRVVGRSASAAYVPDSPEE